MLKPGYSTADGDRNWFEQRTRVVFECPVDKEACLGEHPTHNISCAAGYEGVLCATCMEKTHSMNHRQCSECQKWTGAQIAVLVIVVVLILVLIVAIVHSQAQKRKHTVTTTHMKMCFELMDTIPELVRSLGSSLNTHTVCA